MIIKNNYITILYLFLVLSLFIHQYSSCGSYHHFSKPNSVWESDHSLCRWELRTGDLQSRETPLSEKDSAQLKISDGNLVLFDVPVNKIWSTDINATSNSVVAVLLDEGNLVLRYGFSNFTIWESFDNPTNTWLPGGKIAYNKKSQLLISWKNNDDPAPGLFSLELVPSGKEYIIRWNKTKQYWISGPWKERIFSGVPE